MAKLTIAKKKGHELWKRFFRLSWSMHRYGQIIQECIDIKEKEIIKPSLYPSRFLAGREDNRYNLNIEKSPYDAFVIFYTDEELNDDYIRKKLPVDNPVIKKLLKPKFSASESYQLERLYDVYGGTSVLIGTKRNPSVCHSASGGRIFFGNENFIYYNRDYPIDFDPNARVTDLHLTPLGYEITEIINTIRTIGEDVPFDVILNLSHIAGRKKLLSGLQKYSLNIIHEMLEDYIDLFPSLNEYESPTEKKKRILGDKLYEEFKLLKKRRNEVIKERNDKIDHKDKNIFYSERKKNNFDRTILLKSIQMILTELTGFTYENMSLEEFQSLQKEKKSGYIHVYDAEKKTDQLFFKEGENLSESSSFMLLDEATLYYPLEAEHSMFIFINLMENIYSFSDEMSAREGKEYGSPRDKIRYLFEKKLISEGEYERFMNYYINLRNKLAHENISYGEHKEESKSKSKRKHSQKTQEELYLEKINSMTQMDFFKEYKGSIEKELGDIFSRIFKSLYDMKNKKEPLQEEPQEAKKIAGQKKQSKEQDSRKKE